MEQETDQLKEFCGVFGIYGEELAAHQVYLGLYALQHRGQEAAGIAASDGENLSSHKGLGLVWSVFSSPEVMPRLKGHAAIGHNRYSTRGASDIVNAQPIVIQSRMGQIAAVHNGNITNADELRTDMEQRGSIFQTTADTEVVLHLMARSGRDEIEDMLEEALPELVGAYCLCFLSPQKLVAVRDPLGFRPLNLGRLGDAWVVASETCAFDIIGAEYVRPVEPGEMITIDEQGLRSRFLPRQERLAECVFEHIYFSRPDSMIFGEHVDAVRREFGRLLAEEQPVEADCVVPVPDSALIAALGYAEAARIPFDLGLVRNHYVGRTFIAPHQDKRARNVKVKFNPVESVVRGKRIVLVDDSIVRGTTLKNLVGLLRDAGAAEVHVRISSPPVRYPCYYGIDISERAELIAESMSVEEIRDHLGADSLAYLDVERMLGAVQNGRRCCAACFTGDYPTCVPETYRKDQLGR